MVQFLVIGHIPHTFEVIPANQNGPGLLGWKYKHSLLDWGRWGWEGNVV